MKAAGMEMSDDFLMLKIMCMLIARFPKKATKDFFCFICLGNYQSNNYCSFFSRLFSADGS